MRTIQFHGAAGTVTGSCYQLTSEAGSYLVDCGMFQGPEEIHRLNWTDLQFDARQLEAVFLTHAHLDHCGRLPLLYQKGYRGPVFMTPATFDLLEIALPDAAHVGEMNEGDNALFSAEDAAMVLRYAEMVEYEQALTVGGLTAQYIDAGHILGSASILIEQSDTGRLLFSGDLGNSPQDLIKPTQTFEAAGTVIMESTYGDRLHEPEDVMGLLAQSVTRVERTGGTLLIPAFSIQRTQELLHRLHHLKKEKLIDPRIPVYLDSPMAIRVTDVFKEHPELYNAELTAHQDGDEALSFMSLETVMKHKDSLKIHNEPGPKVIIAGSGMMTGGRILHHAVRYLPDADSGILFVGYQGEETLGREIMEGVQTVVIDGRSVKVQAEVKSITAMSSHADYEQLLRWLGQLDGVKQLYLTHGDNEAREALGEKILGEYGGLGVGMPELYEKVEP